MLHIVRFASPRPGFCARHAMLIFVNFFKIAKIYDFKFSHRRESTRSGKFYRRGGVRRRRASLRNSEVVFEDPDLINDIVIDNYKNSQFGLLAKL